MSELNVSLSQDQLDIRAVKKALHDHRQQKGIAKVHAKRAWEQAMAESRLLHDTLRAEGIDPDTEYGRLVLMGVLEARLARTARGGRSTLTGSDRRALDAATGFDAW